MRMSLRVGAENHRARASFFEARLSFAGKSDIAALSNQILFSTVLRIRSAMQ